VIAGYGSLMKKKVPPGDPCMQFLTEILEASDRAAQLTKSLLLFSRKQVPELKPVRINELVSGMKKMVVRIIGEDIETHLALSSGSPVVIGDRGQLEQVLMNFAANARDAMPDGGALLIETAAADMDEDFVRSHGFGIPGRYARISVSDTGSGMDETTRERVFEPFFTTKGIGKGTGLGLSIVYGIVSQHNGYVECSSRPGRGTVFTVWLPIIPGGSAEAEPEELSPVRGGTETILVADDDEGIRKLVKHILEESGYTVLTAKDGAEAVEQFAGHRDRVGLVLLDVIMPRKSGREAFDEITGLRPGVKTLFFSGYSEDVVQKKRIIEEGLPYLSKPATPRALLSKVREILDRDAAP
jgi:CheY-like chemotaxis protein